MSAMRRFDTPSKRMSFLALIVGVVVLAVSLAVWTHESRYNKIYYTKDHYQWLPVNGPFSGRTERYWTWDYDCIKPLATSRLSSLREAIAEHKISEPESPSFDFSKTLSLKELQRDAAAREAYSAWSSKGISLKSELDFAQDRFSALGYIGFRESEIAAASRLSYSAPAISAFGTPKRQDTRTKEQKFRASLYSKLGLGGFPAHQQNQIFEKCVREFTVGYKKVRTSHLTKIDDWPEDHPIPFFLGVLLTVGGFLGSYGNRASAFAYRATIGRLMSWVKTGEARIDDDPSSRKNDE